jgi:hypothetical protein
MAAKPTMTSCAPRLGLLLRDSAGNPVDRYFSFAAEVESSKPARREMRPLWPTVCAAEKWTEKAEI